MTVKKKHYISPAIESERVDLPDAWACELYDAYSEAPLEHSGSNLPGSLTMLCPD